MLFREVPPIHQQDWVALFPLMETIAPLFQTQAPQKCAKENIQLHKNSPVSEECLRNQAPCSKMIALTSRTAPSSRRFVCTSLLFCNILGSEDLPCVTIPGLWSVSPSDGGPLRAELCLLHFVFLPHFHT